MTSTLHPPGQYSRLGQQSALSSNPSSAYSATSDSTAISQATSVSFDTSSAPSSIGGIYAGNATDAQPTASKGEDTEIVVKNRVVKGLILGKTLGQGGFGWVKEATRQKDGSKRAVKFMLKSKGWSEKDDEEAKNEINSLMKVRHENVVKFYGCDFSCMYPMKDGTTKETVMFEFELANGGDLFDIIFFNPGGLRTDITRFYFRQLIQSIKACHKAGVVHRDIKPQNLLLDNKWNLKLADFGLAKIFANESEQTESKEEFDPMNGVMTTYRGTPGYRAPEIELGRAYNSACDIFSCGVALFVLLTGYPPFKAPLPNDYWYKPVSGDNMRKFWRRHKHKRLKTNIKDLLGKMFQFDPAKRITVEEIENHIWYQGRTVSRDELVPTLCKLRSIALQNYWKDPKRGNMNNVSVKTRVKATRSSAKDIGDTFVSPLVKEIRSWDDKNIPSYTTDIPACVTQFQTQLSGKLIIETVNDFVEGKLGRTDIKSPFHLCGKFQTTNEVLELSVHVFRTQNCNIVHLKRLQGSHSEFNKMWQMIMQTLINFWDDKNTTDNAMTEEEIKAVLEGGEDSEDEEAEVPVS